MLKKLQSSISEFPNQTLTTNTVKVGHYNHRRSIDAVSTVQSDYDGIQQVLPFSSLERFQHFQAIKNHAFPIKDSIIPRNPSPKDQKDVIVMENDKGLSQVPQEILDKRTKVKLLDISKNKFSAFPSEILQMSWLKSLKIDFNEVKSIPSEISKLINLEIFSADNNQIEKLPSTFSKLVRLKQLSLENNALSGFSKEITDLKNLRCLNIIHNRIVSFPCCFKDLANLSEFHFEWFRYTLPQLHINQKWKDGEYNINKLRSKCSDLASRKISTLSFETFVTLMSYEKVDLGGKDFHKRTMLHLATLYGDISVVQYLTSNYPQVMDEEDNDGLTPLCLSLLSENSLITTHLFQCNVNPKKGGGKHGSSLHIATKRKNLEAVKELIRLGEDPNRLDAGGNSPLHYAVSLMIEGQNNAAQIAQHLLEHGADPNIKNRENWAPIHLAVRKKNFPVLEWILSYNFEVQEIHGKGETFKLDKKGGVYSWTSFHIATYSDSHDLVYALGQANVNPFKRSLNGFTAKRISKRQGLTLKLVEKYEQNWVKKNILSTKKLLREESVHVDTDNLKVAQAVKNASKNIFRDMIFKMKNHINVHDATGFGYIMKTRMDLLVPMSQTKTEKEDSFEVIPEPETRNEIEPLETSELVRMNYCSEVSEEGYISLCFPQNVNSTPIRTNRLPEGPTNQIKQFIKGKLDYLSAFHPLNLDLVAFEERLRNESNLSIESLSEEIRILQESFISERIMYHEKFNILSVLKIVHRVILDHVYKIFEVPVIREFLPIYLNDYLNTVAADPKIKSTICQINSFYELVPQAIINTFGPIQNSSYENIFLKQKMIHALEDYKYFPAIAFLQQILDNQYEPLLVLREAQISLKGLKAYFGSQSNQEQSKTAYHNFLKRQYSKVPSTKKFLSPLKKLEKDWL